MAKKSKNSNYVTEKTIAAKNEKEAAKEKAKKDKTTKIIAIAIASSIAAIALIVGILFATGAFDYKPEATYHAAFTFDDGSSLHIELYGNDAPETVKHFIKLCEDGHFDGRTAESLLEGLIYIGKEVDGKEGIKGEFSANGFENKIPMKKGVLCMARGEDYNSAYGRFFILSKNDSSLKGEYAAFGKITDMDGFNGFLKNFVINEDGETVGSPKVTNVSLHAAHH